MDFKYCLNRLMGLHETDVQNWVPLKTLPHEDAEKDYLPFPVEYFPAEIGEQVYKVLNTWLDTAPVVKLPIKSLIGTQTDVIDPYVQSAEKDGSAVHNPIKVVSWNDKNYIIDGHHRTTADLLQGKTEIAAHYLHFNNVSINEVIHLPTPDAVKAYLTQALLK